LRIRADDHTIPDQVLLFLAPRFGRPQRSASRSRLSGGSESPTRPSKSMNHRLDIALVSDLPFSPPQQEHLGRILLHILIRPLLLSGRAGPPHSGRPQFDISVALIARIYLTVHSLYSGDTMLPYFPQPHGIPSTPFASTFWLRAPPVSRWRSLLHL
jgi:hypothetical protein